MPKQKHYKDDILSTSYVYTEYNKAESDILELVRKPEITQLHTERPHLVYQEVDEMNEVIFQDVLKEVFNKKFSHEKSLDEYGIQTKNPNPTLKLLKDKKATTSREFNNQLQLWEREEVIGLSGKPMLMQEEYDEACERILKEQKSDFAITYTFDAIAPSKLKRALNTWIKERTKENDTDKVTLIALYELQNPNTVFKKLIGEAITEYAKRTGDIKKRKERYEEYTKSIELPPEKLHYFNVGFENGEYENFKKHTCSNFAFTECYLKKDMTGPENNFILRVLSDNEKIEWWYKQKDFGDSVFGVKYHDTSEVIDRIFYPDFIFKTKEKLFIVDTKDGQTAKSIETIDKAKGLYDYIQKKKKIEGLELIGGIAVQGGTEFVIHRGEKYNYNANDIDKRQNGWESINTLL